MKGEIDKELAETQWNTQVELSDQTSVGYWNQLIAETEEAMKKYIDWHLEIAPGIAFLVDSSVPAVRMFAAKYADEIGAGKLAVYNSVNASALPEEWEAIKQTDVDSAIVLAFNPTDVSPKGRLDILTVGGTGQEQGLLTSEVKIPALRGRCSMSLRSHSAQARASQSDRWSHSRARLGSRPEADHTTSLMRGRGCADTGRPATQRCGNRVVSAQT